MVPPAYCWQTTEVSSGEKCQQVSRDHGCKIWYTALYHPQANPTERVNRVVKTMMSAYVKDNHRNWDKNLRELGFALRSAVHKVTGYSTNFLNFGREVHCRVREDDVAVQEMPNLGERRGWAGRLEGMPHLFEARLDKAYERARATYNLRRRPVSRLKKTGP